MNWVQFKAQTQLNKKCSSVKHSKIKGVPKLDDANNAGIVSAPRCLGLTRTQITCRRPAITAFSGRREGLHQLHADPHRRRLGQDARRVWAGSHRQGQLWRLPSQRKNAQRPGGHTQAGEANRLVAACSAAACVVVFIFRSTRMH